MATYNIFDFLSSVPEFDGKAEELSLFIRYIEEVRQHAETPQLTLFDLKIRHKIIGKANIALINNNNPMNWDEIKTVLKSNFNVSESIEGLVNKIKTAEFRSSIESFYDYIIGLLTKLNLKASVSGNEGWYTCENNENMVLKIFISKLPNEPKLILNARNPNKLLQAKEILIETEYFYKNFNRKIQKPETQPLSSSSTDRAASSSTRFSSNSGYRNNRSSYQNSSQSRNSTNRPDNFPRTNRLNTDSGGGFHQEDRNADGQTPMELGVVGPSNFQFTAEDLFPI